MIDTIYFKKCSASARRLILAAIEDLDIRDVKIYTSTVGQFTGEVTYLIRGYLMKKSFTRVKGKLALRKWYG